VGILWARDGGGGQGERGGKDLYLADQRDPHSGGLNKNKALEMLVPKKIAIVFSCSVIT